MVNAKYWVRLMKSSASEPGLSRPVQTSKILVLLNLTNVIICSNETFCSQMQISFFRFNSPSSRVLNTIILDDQSHIHLTENRTKKIGIIER